jgi:hypothetical protein
LDLGVPYTIEELIQFISREKYQIGIIDSPHSISLASIATIVKLTQNI